MRLTTYTAQLACLAVGCGGGHAPAPVDPAPGGSAAAPSDDTRRFVIRFSRPSVVGDRTEVVLERSEGVVRRRVVDGRTEQETLERHVSLEAVHTVLSVEPQGRPLRSRYDVARAVVRTPEGERTLVEPGRALVVSRGLGEDGTLELEGGGDLAPDIVEALDMVLSRRVSPETDDEVFGTREPQLPGASWPIDARVAALGLSRDGLRMEPADLDGEARLIGIERVEGVECARLSVELVSRRFASDALPPELELRDSVMRARFEGLYPTDPALPPLADSQEITVGFEGVVSLPDGRQIPIALATHNTGSSRIRLLAGARRP
jgi:hypothetical protein